MAADAAVTRETLFRTLREQWQATEDAIAAAGARFDTPAYEGWTVGDIFRHITSTSHITPADIRAMIASGEHVLTTAEENEAGIEKFRSLDYKMLRIELNTGPWCRLDVHSALQRRGPRADLRDRGLGNRIG